MMIFSATPTFAEEPNAVTEAQEKSALKVNAEDKGNYLSLGVSHLSFSGSGVTTTANGLDFTMRRSLPLDLPLSYLIRVNPGFNGNSLLTIDSGVYASVRVFGSPAHSYEVSDRANLIGPSLVEQKTDQTPVQVYVDLGLNVFPIFGQATTATYSGPSYGISAYLHHWPVSFSARHSAVSASSRNADATAFSLSYYWGGQ